MAQTDLKAQEAHVVRLQATVDEVGEAWVRHLEAAMALLVEDMDQEVVMVLEEDTDLHHVEAMVRREEAWDLTEVALKV